MKCSNCEKEENEIEFEYFFFKKKYDNVCKECRRNGVISDEEYFFKKYDNE